MFTGDSAKDEFARDRSIYAAEAPMLLQTRDELAQFHVCATVYRARCQFRQAHNLLLGHILVLKVKETLDDFNRNRRVIAG